MAKRKFKKIEDFERFFSAIPEERWADGTIKEFGDDGKPQFCALGHLGETETRVTLDSSRLFSDFLSVIPGFKNIGAANRVANINDNNMDLRFEEDDTPKFIKQARLARLAIANKKTPKARILAAIQLVKKFLKPNPKKTRAVKAEKVLAKTSAEVKA